MRSTCAPLLPDTHLKSVGTLVLVGRYCNHIEDSQITELKFAKEQDRSHRDVLGGSLLYNFRASSVFSLSPSLPPRKKDADSPRLRTVLGAWMTS